ncbi:hypothetical protein NDU88_008125 [Pleurodeles waltl]|uniref:Uncharacterized protein n=1 Tax=Pleurodeles waltl TaxID=8319 RepID=A0AAV7SUS5_PLEWA|nr:hypothetical protein NDU88_008125 [Pleurodeles waltl]
MTPNGSTHNAADKLLHCVAQGKEKTVYTIHSLAPRRGGGREVPRVRTQAIALGVMVAVTTFINIVLYRLGAVEGGTLVSDDDDGDDDDGYDDSEDGDDDDGDNDGDNDDGYDDSKDDDDDYC